MGEAKRRRDARARGVPARTPAKPDVAPTAKLYSPSGALLKEVPLASEYQFSPDPPRPDETVYQLYHSFVGPKVLGLKPTIHAGRVLCTFQVPGGGRDDVGLIVLAGTAAPPAGTRFAIRMLAPEDQTPKPESNNAEERHDPEPAEQTGALPEAPEIQEPARAPDQVPGLEPQTGNPETGEGA